ncbi:unnamed protein product [Ostreobium quekettii]|uniref:Uncharacterized protein n=1 Tax=Ostreobium quekettii TaxID=121088 RepID=A0A8S1J590_9CHLO|nr:unnamed protein product [Ostreobium quekettii]
MLHWKFLSVAGKVPRTVEGREMDLPMAESPKMGTGHGSRASNLDRRIREDWDGHACTNGNMFEMKIGDVWEGGALKTRVMSLENLKKMLIHRRQGEGWEAELEKAFRVEKFPADGVEIEYAGMMKAAVVEGGSSATPVELEFGKDAQQNYIFSAAPKEWHQFANRDRAERMFAWALKKCNQDRLLNRGMFMVVEVLTASRIVFLRAQSSGRVTVLKTDIKGVRSVDGPDDLCSLRFAQVEGMLQFRSPTVEMQRVVRAQEGACIVKVKNNRRLRASRNFDKPGFF